MSKELNLDQVEDIVIRENFSILQDDARENPFNNGDFRFFEIILSTSVSNKKIKHGLDFAPKDVVQLSVSNNATVTWHYDNFDKENIELSTTDSCTIRCFIGYYNNTRI